LREDVEVELLNTTTPIRADLARLFIQYKARPRARRLDRPAGVERVNDITAALIGCGQIALQRGDAAWLERHRWFGDACQRLFADQPAVKLDG
jgi:hypothetical protein